MSESAGPPESRGFMVRGRVQGVGFRWWTRSQAEELGLGGTVRNLPDGRVAVYVHGDSAGLDRFAELLEGGPRFASVEGVELMESPPPQELPSEFRIET